ncbi:MAG: hydrogenase iron-sulfur subunit [Syntrophobacteraceae bacterium]|jgi:coenzyme F420-reducing hydrogenase delta subunit|nr:hydrogenase iron-sulfur subunit [Syntrophobacteraceae bacterium]
MPRAFGGRSPVSQAAEALPAWIPVSFGDAFRPLRLFRVIHNEGGWTRMDQDFEPIIVCYCCQWCSYAAADLAGSMRLQYPTNVRIVKVPCTGRVDAIFLMKALEQGADGVFVSGCLLGDCHYLSGNYRAQKRVACVKEILGKIGINPDRVEMYFNSSAMGPQFAQCCKDFTDRVRELGPGLRKGRKLRDRERMETQAAAG